jgi:hypothetical protein
MNRILRPFAFASDLSPSFLLAPQQPRSGDFFGKWSLMDEFWCLLMDEIGCLLYGKYLDLFCFI